MFLPNRNKCERTEVLAITRKGHAAGKPSCESSRAPDGHRARKRAIRAPGAVGEGRPGPPKPQRHAQRALAAPEGHQEHFPVLAH